MSDPVTAWAETGVSGSSSELPVADELVDELLDELFDERGDAACWANRVCCECGRLNDVERPQTCEACGATFD